MRNRLRPCTNRRGKAVASPPKSGRPRDADRERQLLVATLDLLAEVGYDRLTIEAVASHCGAGKTTLYRRWPGKTELVADAVALFHADAAVPDTGDLRTDLLMSASTWHTADTRRDAVVAGLLTAMARDPELRETVRAAVADPGNAVFDQVVAQARARGEVTAEVDTEVLACVLPAMVFHQITVRSGPVDRTLMETIVDQVILPALTRPA